MKIILNGCEQEFDTPITLSALLDAIGYGGRRVAVEVNLEIVPRSRYAELQLCADDRIEIVHAIGGG